MSTVFWKPEEVGRMVTLHAAWVADNGYETAVFHTEAEAINFAWKRWRSIPTVTRRPPYYGEEDDAAGPTTEDA